MEQLKDKIMNAFQGKVVRKDLAFQVKGNLPVPTFVLEYLLGQYCACDDEDLIAQGLEKVKSVIQNNYVHRAAAEEVKGKIREAGKYRIIDKISVQLNDRADQYEATFANLGLNKIPIGSDNVRRNPKLLSGNGVWSIVNINYLSGDDVKVRWEIESLKPIQISNISLQEYIDQRKHFNTEEWIDLLVHTVGLNPDKLNRREKFITLARLLPLVENNFNFMELGPKGTGKSHVFSELSPYGVLVSGGDVTSARLFSKISGNNEILGLVGYWDVVAWDEYEQQKGKSTDAVLVDTMQNYLANKTFNRGKATHEASASMAFVGNTKHTVPYMLKNSHLFESIPTGFIKGAFLDRIHLYNPGWEISSLKKDSFSKGYGLITDYIAAVLHELRVQDHSALLNQYAKFDTSLSERDHSAIRKTFSGMIKLLYPDLNFTKEEILEIVDFAGECRKRVKDQLYIVDETFSADKPAIFQYLRVDNGKTIVVETLERIENGLAITEPVLPEPEPEPVATQTNSSEPQEKKPVRLASKLVNIRANQKGVSYKSLFGDYMRTAKRIEVVDPFIRSPYQIDNFIELVQVIREVSDNPEELHITLSTANEEARIPEMIDIFDDMTDELALYGIEFEYNFDATHDRQITMDNGWTIVMGRGLDIFEKFNRFSIGSVRQECRRCRESSFTFIENV